MAPNDRWQDILALAGKQHDFMEMLCTSATADYRRQGGEIYCRKGCSGCCSLAVNCTAADALLLAKSLTEQQQTALAAHIEKLAGKITAVVDLKGYLRLHRQELGSCPFLTGGSCGVYRARPLACRALLSTKESRWCTADFSGLDREAKEAFLDSLDRSVTAFPLHYLAASGDAGQQLEMQAAMLLTKEFGFSLYGSMPVLVHLFAAYDLVNSIAAGAEAVLERASSLGLGSPFLLQVEQL